ncbi:hypothetical protein [Moorena bouillonii]|nr:hypothetical protein [Moorena bouillonii]
MENFGETEWTAQRIFVDEIERMLVDAIALTQWSAQWICGGWDTG